MKRWSLFRSIGIGVLCGLIAATTASAQMMQGENPHRGGMERPMGHPPTAGMQGGNFFSMEGLKQALNLNDEQAKKLHDLFTDYRKGVIQKRANLQVAQIELDEMIADPKLDLSKIEKKAKEKEAMETDLLMFRVRSMAKAKEFLSDAQYNQFRSMIERRMMMSEGMHRMMHGMPGGMMGMEMGKGMMGMESPHGSVEKMEPPHGSMGKPDPYGEGDDD